MTTTLQDIADVVGVSRVTVSRVLRGKVKGCWPKSAAQVERIRRVAEELDYRVDWRAKTLKTGRTHLIGLLSTDKPQTRLHDPRLLDALTDAFGTLGYHLTYVRVRPADAGRQRGDGFADSRFDGLLVDYHLEEEELRVVQQAQAPAVIINAPAPAPVDGGDGGDGGCGIVSVMPDHAEAGRLAAGHLLELGHRRVAFVRTPTGERSRWPQHMYNAWRAAFRREVEAAGGVYAEVEAVAERLEDHAAGYAEALGAALGGPDAPTALLASNPEQAAEVLLPHLRAAGLRCPEDVSVLAMGHQREAGWTSPPLTCLHLPFDEVGADSARRLVAMIEGREAEPPPRFGLRVVPAGSTGPPPPPAAAAAAG